MGKEKELPHEGRPLLSDYTLFLSYTLSLLEQKLLEGRGCSLLSCIHPGPRHGGIHVEKDDLSVRSPSLGRT